MPTFETLIIPSFIAGLLTFLAPCTLPLVPGYLGFISGVSQKDINDPEKLRKVRPKIFLNGLFYVIGFSLVFIILGSLFGLGGFALAKYRFWLARLGGIFVIIFGLFMLSEFFNLNIFSFLRRERQFRLGNRFITPGKPLSSFAVGSAFAFGWTPCVGPILGTILTLAATTSTVLEGAFLLGVFSFGLAIPFLTIAFGIGSASHSLAKINKYLNLIYAIGGLFLIFLGILLFTNQFGAWISFFYRLFGFINYDRILNYL